MAWEPITLAELPYLDKNVALEGRAVEVMPYWDGAEWHMWLPHDRGLLPMRGVPMASDYVAREPQAPTDFCIPFVNFIWQRSSWKHAIGRLNQVEEDVRNLGTSFAKFQHFHEHRASIGHGVDLFAGTEVEYLFMLARSIADLFHDLFRDLWNQNVKLRHADGTLRNPRQLPEKLSRLVFAQPPGQETSVRTVDELVSRSGLTQSMAAAYAQVGEFLLPIRRARDAIAHRGARQPLIFSTDRGFCVNPDEGPFRFFKVWKDEHRLNKNLVSLVPLLAHLVFHSIDAGTILANGLAKQIEFLPEIAPGYRVFVRGFHNAALIQAMRIAVEGASPWPEPEPGAPTESETA